MSVHLHRTRQWTAWTLTAIALSPFAFCFGSSEFGPEVPLSPVDGRMTIGGHLPGQLAICLDNGPYHVACGWLKADGSFRLSDLRWYEGGVVPGTYHAHLFTHSQGPHIPLKYREAKTSGIVIHIAPGWNGLSIDLP